MTRGISASVVLLLAVAHLHGALPAAADETTLQAAADNWLREDAASRNYGTDAQLRTRPGAQGRANHAIVLFDLTNIPAGATIDSATFGIYEESTRNNTQTITLYRLTESWTEPDSTWNSRDGTDSWSTPGGTYDSTPLGSFHPTSVGWKTFDVTSVVQNWVHGTYANAGFVLVATTTANTGAVRFTSREGARAHRPYLDVSVSYPSNQDPTVDAVAIYETDHATIATAMTPQSEYAAKVTVTDLDTLADLNTVTLTIFYDADGDDDPADVPGSGNTQTAAILTCTVGYPPTWSIDPSADTTWVLVGDNSVQPSLTNTTGDFWFHFRPAKVATQATDWDAYAVAEDGGASLASLYDGSDYDMNWYGEITVNTTSVDWGEVGLGTDFDANPQIGISVTYISNGSYYQQVKSDASWSGAGTSLSLNGAGSPGSGEFSLKADDTAILGSAVLVPSNYVTIDSESQTGEAGNTESANALWLKIGASGIPAVTYNGTVYYQIAP